MNQLYDGVMTMQENHQAIKDIRERLMALDTFGKRLKVLRVDRDLSQVELRNNMEAVCKVSIGETYISELERTDRMPSLEVAAAMAKVLDVSIDYLGFLIDDALSYKRVLPPDHYFSEEADRVARMVDGMPKEQRYVVLNIVRSIDTGPSTRQIEQIKIRQMLDSIEERQGRAVRLEVEQIMRDKGLIIDGDV